MPRSFHDIGELDIGKMPITDIYTDMPLNISTDPDTDIGLIGFTDTNISVLYQ